MSNRVKLKGALAQPAPRQSRIERIQNTFAGRYNAYGCSMCGKAYLTLDIDPGVTPMFMPCFATQGCKGQAVSQGYPEGDPPAYMGEPIIHWVRPEPHELKHLPPQLKQHALKGGLIRKATAATPDWVRPLL